MLDRIERRLCFAREVFRAGTRHVLATWIAVATFGLVSCAWADDEAPPSPSQVRVAAWLDAARHGPDLRWRVMLSWDLLFTNPERAPTTAVLQPLATLLDAANGSTDPLTLEMLLFLCRPAPGGACNGVDLARRWVQADTQNQRAWVALAVAQRAAGDVATARETFVRGARASTWRDPLVEGWRFVEHATHDVAEPADRFSLLTFGQSRVLAMTGSPQSPYGFCREDRDIEAIRAACLRLAATIDRDSGSVIDLVVNVPLAARAGADDATIAAYQRRADAMRWALAAEWKRHPELVDESDDSDNPRSRALVEWLATMMRQGDRRVAEAYLLSEHVGETEAARRQVESMGADQRARRTTTLARTRSVLPPAGSRP